MRSIGTIFAAIFFLWYLSYDIEGYDQDHVKYFNQHVSHRFIFEKDTLLLKKISNNFLSFDKMQIPIDSIQRTDEHFFFIKSNHKLKTLKLLEDI